MHGTGRLFGMQRRNVKSMNRAVIKPGEERPYERRAGNGV